MNELKLEQKEEEITTKYREFLGEVRAAFNRHCDEIKAEATRKLEGVPEEDQETRQKVLDEQNAKLDKTLVELKQLLAKREAKVRIQLEEIANLREQEEFSLDDELAQVEGGQKEHAA